MKRADLESVLFICYNFRIWLFMKEYDMIKNIRTKEMFFGPE